MVSPWAYHSATVRRQPGADLGMRVEAQAAADLEHDPVELVAQQEVAHVAAGEAELVAAGKVEVDPAHGQEGPVANPRLPQGHALLAPALDELQRDDDPVEGAAVVAAGHHDPRGPDHEGVPFGRRQGPSSPARAAAAATSGWLASPTTIAVRPGGASPIATGSATPN